MTTAQGKAKISSNLENLDVKIGFMLQLLRISLLATEHTDVITKYVLNK